MTTDDERLSAMQVVLRLERTVQDYIIAHSTVHNGLVNPGVLDQRYHDNLQDLDAIKVQVASHERTIQRVIGALVFVSALGFGTLALLILRIAGYIV